MNKLFLSGVVEVDDDFTPGDCELCKLFYENCYSGNCPIKIDKDDPGILYLDVK